MLHRSLGSRMKPFRYVMIARSGYSCPEALLRTTFFSVHPTTKPDIRRVSIELRGS